jgi:hypothetical protein
MTALRLTGSVNDSAELLLDADCPAAGAGACVVVPEQAARTSVASVAVPASLRLDMNPSFYDGAIATFN